MPAIKNQKSKIVKSSNCLRGLSFLSILPFMSYRTIVRHLRACTPRCLTIVRQDTLGLALLVGFERLLWFAFSASIRHERLAIPRRCTMCPFLRHFGQWVPNIMTCILTQKYA